MKSPSFPRRRVPAWVSGVAMLAFLGAGPGRAASLFELSGQTTSGGVVAFDQGGNNLAQLVRDMVGGQGQFNFLANRAFVAGLRYADVPNALRFNVSGGTVWTAQLSSAQFQPGLIQRNFTAASQADLQSQVEAYLKKDGAADYARFLAAIASRSGAGVLDGNPMASTAVSANQSFMEYGLRPTETEDERASDAPPPGRSGFSSVADFGSFRSQGLEGQSYSWTPMIPVALGEARRVRLEISLPLAYTRLEGADEYRVGTKIGLAMLAVKRTKDQPWLWQVTPHVGASVDGSTDMAVGGLVVSGGATSYLSYRRGAWEFSMGNHASVYEGMSVTVDGYTFDPHLRQQILKNGVKVGRSLGNRWYAEAYVVDTEFVQAAFVPRYTTIGAGVGYRAANRKGFLMLGSYTDIGPRYDSVHFQFGTGWKF